MGGNSDGATVGSRVGELNAKRVEGGNEISNCIEGSSVDNEVDGLETCSFGSNDGTSEVKGVTIKDKSSVVRIKLSNVDGH